MKSTPETRYFELAQQFSEWRTNFIKQKEGPLTEPEQELKKSVERFLATVEFMKNGLDFPYQTMTIAMDVTLKYLNRQMTKEEYQPYAADMNKQFAACKGFGQPNTLLAAALNSASWTVFVLSIVGMLSGGFTPFVLGVVGFFGSYFMHDVAKMQAEKQGKVTSEVNLGEDMQNIEEHLVQLSM